ncbi:hypothetical protein VTI74DRAFT_5925 [Chaetomium olivicolor]
MSFNSVLAKKERPDFAVKAMKAPLEEAVAANESVLPSNTAEVIVREGAQTSAADTRSYITAVCVEGSGDFIQTVHLPTSK